MHYTGTETTYKYKQDYLQYIQTNNTKRMREVLQISSQEGKHMSLYI